MFMAVSGPFLQGIRADLYHNILCKMLWYKFVCIDRFLIIYINYVVDLIFYVFMAYNG
jgi:hypothetical protein